jgi:hypothetical protein
MTQPKLPTGWWLWSVSASDIRRLKRVSSSHIAGWIRSGRNPAGDPELNH